MENERIKARRKLEAKRLASLRNEMEESSRYSRNDRMMDLYDHDIEDEAFSIKRLTKMKITAKTKVKKKKSTMKKEQKDC